MTYHCNFCELRRQRLFAEILEQSLLEVEKEHEYSVHMVENESEEPSWENRVLHFKNKPLTCTCR